MMLYNEKVNCHIELFDKDAEIPTQGRKKNYMSLPNLNYVE